MGDPTVGDAAMETANVGSADVAAAAEMSAPTAVGLGLSNAGSHKDRRPGQEQDNTECLCCAKHFFSSFVEPPCMTMK